MGIELLSSQEKSSVKASTGKLRNNRPYTACNQKINPLKQEGTIDERLIDLPQ
ncbi:MAG: hypothetical protein ACFB2X_19665 [Rivularia sp. (in: cyanobacteria)]